jgi:hypothetical protein
MAEAKRELLSIGAFFIIVVVAVLLYAAAVITDWTLIFPLILALFGIWMLALAAMRASNRQKYERGAFSTVGLGLVLIAVGGGWFLVGYGVSLLYAVALVLIVLAALAIAAALKRK